VERGEGPTVRSGQCIIGRSATAALHRANPHNTARGDLLDEPTSALDPIRMHKIEDLIDELKQHVTIGIVTHNMQ